ncbi:hypothetical protein [Pseudomonas syringae]|uniref:hypothetical protein n=1 Tax=Pseudomonas syringae TaxID=317 RepID=UPI003F865B4D
MRSDDSVIAITRAFALIFEVSMIHPTLGHQHGYVANRSVLLETVASCFGFVGACLAQLRATLQSKRQPAVNLKIDGSQRRVDLKVDNIDIAFLMGKLHWFIVH